MDALPGTIGTTNRVRLRAAAAVAAATVTAARKGGGGEDNGHSKEEDLDGTDGGEDEDVVGRRKHALAVEIPRTVLFRLVRDGSL